MPRGNRTGPMGMGPMTGRGAGYCAGFSVPGFMNQIFRSIRIFQGRGSKRMFWLAGLLPRGRYINNRWTNRRIQK
jgi:hypothetical protein